MPDSVGTQRNRLDEKPRIYAGLQGSCGTCRKASEAKLFSDAELTENHAKQIVGTEFSGDFRERFLAQAQFFR